MFQEDGNFIKTLVPLSIINYLHLGVFFSLPIQDKTFSEEEHVLCYAWVWILKWKAPKPFLYMEDFLEIISE